MKLSKKDIIKYIIVLILILSIFLPIKLIRKSLAETASFTLSAVLYDTNMYAGGSGTPLTTSGATVNSWQYGTSKYLQIDPKITANGKKHFLKVILPKELYAVSSELVTPAGFSDLKFTKNSPLSVNDHSVNYDLKTYSGTFEYTMDVGFETGNIQMELQWDDYLWDKRANVSITPSGIKPISVILYEEGDNGDLTQLRELSISKVTSGSAVSGSGGSHIYTMDQLQYDSVSLEAPYNKDVKSTIILRNMTYAGYYHYYPTLQITVQLPSYTYNGRKYYLTVDDTTPTFSGFYGNKVGYTVDTSRMSNQGIIVYNFTDFYWQINANMMSISLRFPDGLKSVSNIKSFAFTGGSYVGVAKSDNGDSNITFFNIGMPTLTYKTEVEEKVTAFSSGTDATMVERPSNAVSRLGGFYLENSGTGDSCAKTITMNFDTGNTNRVKVTTVQTFADQLSETIPIEYTLVDENGQRVYLNSSGEKVSSGTSGAISTWTYNMKNSHYGSSQYSNIFNTFTRSMLPESQRSYYLKTVKYTIQSIKSKARLYAYQSNASLTGAGNFLGYVKENANDGDNSTHTVTVTSANSKYGALSSSCNTTLRNTSTPSFGISSASLNKSSITAGENIEIKGTASVAAYPYGNSGWLKGIRLGVTLPKGVSINNDSVEITSASGTKITPKQITSKDLNNGNFLWTFILPDDTCIGYARENAAALETGDYINFKFQVDTETTMNEVTIFARDALQVAGLYQTNSAGGSWSWASSKDINDLNGNGQTTDVVGGVNASNTSSCSISSQNATMNIKDKVTLTSGGVTGQETDKVVLKTPEDVITYTIEFENESAGKAKNFSYYIPIPKSSSANDSFIQNQTKNGGFDLSMTGVPTLEGDDLFNISYTFQTGLTYNTAQSASSWYTKEQIEEDPSLKWENVTMIKFTGKNVQINNGDQSKMTYKLKYSGSAFAEEAGMSNEWNGAGYYQYTNGDRVSSGNYATNKITASLEYSIEGEDITLTAARNRSPIVPEDVNEITIDKAKFPKFKNSQTFEIQSIENYNVTMQTKQYVQENVDMRSIYANTTFAITVALEGQEESDIIQNAINTQVGNSQAGKEPQFTFRLYNGNRLNDNFTSRYVVVTFKSDNGVTFKQKIIINREVSRAVNIQNSIMSGKTYISFDDNDNSTTISGDSAFTAQIVTDYIPAFFKGQEILFSDKMPIGTTIVLAKINDPDNPLYYYYKFTESKNAVDFDELISMGTTNTHNYEYADKEGDRTVDNLLAIVDFSKVEGGQINPGSYTIRVRMKGDGEDDYLSDELTVVTTQRRDFSFSINENIPVKEQSVVNYVIGDQSSAESKYTGKKVALVIQAPEEIPLDANILVENTTTYHMNSNRQFIIPLGDIEQTNGNLGISMQSEQFPIKGAEYKCTAALWVSATSNGANPMLGEKIEEKNVTFTVEKQLEPALKVKGMNKRIIRSNEISENMTLDFEYKPDTDCYVTIELNQKEGSFYRKVTNLLSQVNGSTNHNMGAFTINAVEGNNTVTMRVANTIPIGTYRLILRVYSKSGEELLQVPYNFIITQAN